MAEKGKVERQPWLKQKRRLRVSFEIETDAPWWLLRRAYEGGVEFYDKDGLVTGREDFVRGTVKMEKADG